MFNLVGITQGRNIPSTRFRWSQYADDLACEGFIVSEFASHFGAYPPASRGKRPFWLTASIAEGLVRTLNSSRFSLRFLQRNLISTLCTWEPLLRKPFVFDVDDAIFLGPRGNNANRIANSASIIICGNDFLANHFEKFGVVTVLPTAVDTARYSLRSNQWPDKRIVGWSGSSSGLKYLYKIESALLSLLEKHPDVVLKIVSDKAPMFKIIPPERLIYEQWSPQREVAALQEFSVGIMPLEDDLWARGKCSFKMLTYMAVGIPVVVSPVGMNADVLGQAACGFGPRSEEEWVDAISCLLIDSSLAEKMGSAGRQLIEARYAKNIVGPKLACILKSQI